MGRRGEGCESMVSALFTSAIAHCVLAAQGAPKKQLASLEKVCDRFANWRWNTLANVTKDLLRMQDAIEHALGDDDAATHLSKRYALAMAKFLASSRSAQFWQRTLQLDSAVAPLITLIGWLKGCKRHDAELSRGAAVDCHWKGCRATQMQGRFSQAKADLAALRIAADTYSDVASAVARGLSTLSLKMEWVSELPFLIWQVASGHASSAGVRTFHKLYY